MKKDVKTFVEMLRSLARVENRDVVREQLEDFRPEDIAEAFQRLTVQEGLGLLRQLDDETAGYILVELPTEITRQYIDELPDLTLAHYLDVLPMDDAIELREEIEPERFEALLEVIPREDAQELRRLLSYPEDSAGRLMTEDFVEVRPDEKMADLLQHIREAPEGEYETVNDLYVLDEDRHLLGVFSLRQAIRADPEATAREIMIEDAVTSRADSRAEDVARQIARYGFYAMPVLDDRARMLGIFTVDDSQEVLEQAETIDVLKLGGVGGDAEAYLSLGVWQLAWRRFWWLFFLFLAETLTGSVLRYYGQGSGSQELRLSPIAYFIPLLIGAGGNSGSQTTTTITRALAVGDIRLSDAMVVLRKEFLTALLVGSLLGITGFARAILWKSPFDLCIVVGLTLPAIVIWATVVGSMLPMAAKRIGADPAVMSSPFISTFVDATGLIIYFEIAKRIVTSFHV